MFFTHTVLLVWYWKHNTIHTQTHMSHSLTVYSLSFFHFIDKMHATSAKNWLHLYLVLGLILLIRSHTCTNICKQRTNSGFHGDLIKVHIQTLHNVKRFENSRAWLWTIVTTTFFMDSFSFFSFFYFLSQSFYLVVVLIEMHHTFLHKNSFF